MQYMIVNVDTTLDTTTVHRMYELRHCLAQLDRNYGHLITGGKTMEGVYALLLLCRLSLP